MPLLSFRGKPEVGCMVGKLPLPSTTPLTLVSVGLLSHIHTMSSPDHLQKAMVNDQTTDLPHKGTDEMFMCDERPVCARGGGLCAPGLLHYLSSRIERKRVS